MGGKFAPGLRGFPTPNDVPDDGGYVVFRLPANNEWAGLILGAAQLLSYSYNFYQWGDMTPDEAAEAFRVIVDQAPFNGCGCVLPGGSKVIRININGHFEELGDNNEWQEPSGDYEIPPVPTREGGTSSDKRCLAAANAANVLEQLYEETVDMIAEGLSLIEIIGGLLLLIASLIAGAIGLAAAALIEIIAIAFREFVAAATFLGADVWDATFTDALRCMLFECASVEADVVTFDWDCLVDKLYDNTNPFDLTGAQLRLLGQVGFLLNIISIDGLNLAGATTAITEADCSACDTRWCFRMDFTTDDFGWQSACYLFPTAACSSVWDTDGWHSNLGSTGTGITRFNIIELTFDPAEIYEISTECHIVGTSGTGTMGASIYTNEPGGTPSDQVVIPQSNDNYGVVLEIDPAEVISYVEINSFVNPPSGGVSETGQSYITSIVFKGRGECPFGEPNCEV